MDLKYFKNLSKEVILELDYLSEQECELNTNYENNDISDFDYEIGTAEIATQQESLENILSCILEEISKLKEYESIK